MIATTNPAIIARLAAHWLICSAALLFFAVSITAFCAVVLAAVAADRVWPNAGMGNCWTHVLPRWWRRGGYIPPGESPRMIPASLAQASARMPGVPNGQHIKLDQYGRQINRIRQ